jgi:hypothetical protein
MHDAYWYRVKVPLNESLWSHAQTFERDQSTKVWIVEWLCIQVFKCLLQTQTWMIIWHRLQCKRGEWRIWGRRFKEAGKVSTVFDQLKETLPSRRNEL